MTGAGLTVEQYVEAKRLTLELAYELGLRTVEYRGKPAVAIPYRDQDGRELVVRYRVSLSGPDPFRWPQGTKAKGLIYGLERWKQAARAGRALIVEGESDVDTAALHDVVAFGIPGVSNFDDELTSPALEGIKRIVLMREPDEGGTRFLAELRSSRLRPRVVVASLNGYKDVSELHLAVDGDHEAFLRELEAAIDTAEPLEPAGEEEPKPRRTFPGLRHVDAVKREVPETTQIVEDLIEAGTLGTIAGLPETHKSFLAVATACRVAAGLSGAVLLGRLPVLMHGPVGYWWQDDSEANELRRLQDYARRHELTGELPLVWHLNEGLRLPDDIPALVEEIEREGQVLAVLDSLYNFLPGLSLKDEDVAAVLAVVKAEVCDATGSAVLFVDHAPWPSESNRGQRRGYGSVFKAAVQRWGVYLERDGSKLWLEARGNNVRGLKRTLVVWNEDELELRLVDMADEERSEEELDEAVRAFVTEHPGSSTTKVRGVEGRDSTIDSSLERLKARAEVVDLGRDGGPWSGRAGAPRYWYPADHAGLTSAPLFGPSRAEVESQGIQEANLGPSAAPPRGAEVVRAEVEVPAHDLTFDDDEVERLAELGRETEAGLAGREEDDRDR